MARYGRTKQNHLNNIVLFCAIALSGPAIAGEKPPVIPDQPSSLTVPSRVSAAVEFGLPAIAAAIERDIPKRLATIDERIGCVNRRVLIFRVRANCDVDGFADRGALSLYAAVITLLAPFRSSGASKVRAPTGLLPAFTAMPKDGPSWRSNPARS
jgi:hypothetical protein